MSVFKKKNIKDLNNKFYVLAMAYQQQNIPPKPSPRAPPPPKAFTPPPPRQYSPPKPKKKKSREQLKRSQIVAIVILVFLIIFLIFIAYLSTVLISKQATGEIARHSEQYPYKFEVQDILSQKIPTRIEVSASNDVEVYIIKENDFNESMGISELRGLSINENNQESTNFVFEDYLAPGDYYIISYRKDNNEDVSLDYEITRFYLMPFLWLISLIFLIPIIICVTWIIILQSRKASALPEKYQDMNYDRITQHYPDEYGYSDSRISYESYYHIDEKAKYHPTGARHTEYSADYYGSDSQYIDASNIDRAPMNPHQDRDRYIAPQERTQHWSEQAPPMPAESHHESRRRRVDYEEDTNKASTTTTVPCKCGEIIVITDTTRPLRIKCQRCGRRGILEGIKKSPEDDIFY